MSLVPRTNDSLWFKDAIIYEVSVRAFFDSNADGIGDFQAGLDRIGIDNAVFSGLDGGALPAGAFTTGSAAKDADDRIIYDPTTGALWFDADGSGSGAAMQFAQVQQNLTLSGTDFVVI